MGLRFFADQCVPIEHYSGKLFLVEVHRIRIRQ